MPMDTDRFDQMLTYALQKHSESVPADFTDRMLKQIRLSQEQKILARVVLHERLTLAGCIIFCSTVIFTAMVFPEIAAVFRNIVISMTEHGKALSDRLPQAIKALVSDWQFFTILGAAFLFAIYSVVELFIDDSSRRSVP